MFQAACIVHPPPSPPPQFYGILYHHDTHFTLDTVNQHSSEDTTECTWSLQRQSEVTSEFFVGSLKGRVTCILTWHILDETQINGVKKMTQLTHSLIY